MKEPRLEVHVLGAFVGLVCAVVVFPAARSRADERSECFAAYEEAQRLRQQGALLASRERLLRCAQLSCPVQVSDDCTTWTNEVNVSLASVVFAVTDAHGHDLKDVRIFADDKLLATAADGRAIPIDPGAYRFRFEPRVGRTVERSWVIHESEKHRIVRVKLLERDAPAPSSVVNKPMSKSVPIASYVLGGVSLAGLGMFGTLAALGRATYAEGEHCARDRGCDKLEALIARGKREYVLADVGLGIAVASAISAALSYMLSADSETALHAVLLPDAASVSLNGRF